MTSSSSRANTAPAQVRQTRQQFVNPEDYLSFELAKAVRQLPPLYTRLLAASLSAFLFWAIAWAYFSKIDEVAVTSGELIPSVQVRPIRALEGGVIRQILVEEGQEVSAGEELIIQDPSLNDAEINRLQAAANLIQQDVNRLQAELDGTGNTGIIVQDQLTSARLQEFATSQAAAAAEVERLAAAVQETKAQLERIQANLPNARELLANAQDREESLRSLIDGAIPRFDYLTAQDQVTEAKDRVTSLERDLAVQQQTILQAEQAYQSALQERDRLDSTRRSEILTQLTQRQEELANVQGQLKQASVRAEGQTITAPIAGTIYNIQATLAEKTIEPGEEILSILPNDQKLLLEVKILNRDIGYIQTDMRAKVKIATFPFQEFGTIEGTVIHISPNATIDEKLGPVFTAHIQLARTTMPFRGDMVELVPGMSATGDIVTRQKSVLTFLTEPITRRFSDAFSVR
ncbi:MAG: HlyD family type I secretion periplasmic adaptor subunit [Leptolyngbyaceae bacterium]|nr:HlyD family type I secretion periplasmic adaptor subunit [Leptolyngbyaceae bacterium]